MSWKSFLPATRYPSETSTGSRRERSSSTPPFGAFSAHVDDHFRPTLTAPRVAEGLPGLVERVLAVDDRRELALLDEPREERKILAAGLRNEHHDALLEQ